MQTYRSVPLDRLTTPEESAFDAFAKVKREMGFTADRIGFEQAEAFEPAAFGPNFFRGCTARLLRRAFPSAALAPADELLAEMRCIKTIAEMEHIRTACRIAEQAFLQGSRVLRSGLTEAEAAAGFRIPLSTCVSAFSQVKRCDGFTYCMSGPNSSHASGPFSHSRTRKIEPGDLVIMQCHSYADGYWASVARTYAVGPLDGAKRMMLEAVFAARDAALAAIRPGMKAAEVDQVTQSTLGSHGLSGAVRHPSGHGAGFAAIDPTARPRLHPKSDDVLEAGMILKLEPGVYNEEHGGVRSSDMVAITEHGAEILTPFQWGIGELTLNGSH